MKRFVLLIFIAAFSFHAVAQKKSVAILETYCKENNIGYGYLLMIGSGIETGITHNENYIAYNRSQVSALMEEHRFQRSGLVKDVDIRRFGQLAGVDYVLVSEAAKVDGLVYVTAKVLNVETGRYDMTDNELMDFNARAINTGCNNLAAKLLKGGTLPTENIPITTGDDKSNDDANNNVTGRNIGLPQPKKGIAVKEGLLGYWNFDNANTHDTTDNHNNANIVGSASFVNQTPNGYGKALSLYSADQCLIVPDNIISATFTICFWAKDFSCPGLLWCEQRGRGLGINKDGDVVMLRWDASFFQPLKFDYNVRGIMSRGWHHFALTVREGTSGYGGNIFCLYVDGAKVDEREGSYWYHNSKFQFGGAITDAENSMDYNSKEKVIVRAMSFKVDNIRLYSRQLDKNEIKSIYDFER